MVRAARETRHGTLPGTVLRRAAVGDRADADLLAARQSPAALRSQVRGFDPPPFGAPPRGPPAGRGLGAPGLPVGGLPGRRRL
jgi:hypothetical protein